MKKTIKLFSLLASIALAGVSPALADATAAATPAAPTVTVGGLVDTYYSFNFANYSNNADLNGNNGVVYNASDNAFTLGLAEANFTATQGNGSAHLTLAYGQTADANAYGGGTGFTVQNAYISYVADQWTFNAGKFVTWMGNEVVESKSNMNYSRSLLYWFTIPVWHTGVSANFAPSSQFGGTVYLTDGWNSTGASLLGKTYGLQLSFKPDSTFGIILNGIAGPGWLTDITPSNSASYGAGRFVGELIASFTPDSKWSFALDAEYGVQDLVGSNAPMSAPMTLGDGSTMGSAPFYGAALYGRYQMESDWAVALRLEYLKDTYGILGLYGINNIDSLGGFPVFGTAGPYSVEGKEGTLTLEHNFTPNTLLRLEGRLDMASAYGAAANIFPGASSSEFTGTAGFVFSY